MNKIVYYVAVSLDGFIAGPGDDASAFVGEDAVAQYLEDLKHFNTVIMGRGTYEFGYKFGLEPGQPAYPHMQHYIFSRSLQFDTCSEQVHIVDYNLDVLNEIRHRSDGDIYLCGGGEFAGWVLSNKQLDVLKIKLNPIVLGQGIPLFSNVDFVRWELKQSVRYEDDIQIMEYLPVYK